MQELAATFGRTVMIAPPQTYSKYRATSQRKLQPPSPATRAQLLKPNARYSDESRPVIYRPTKRISLEGRPSIRSPRKVWTKENDCSERRSKSIRSSLEHM